MNRPKPRITTVLLARRAGALKRHLRAAIKGDRNGVHQARVASRRLREAVPVLSFGLDGSKAGKARRKIRRLTQALGAVREMDVTLVLIEELAARGTAPRLALEEVRADVIKEHDRRREVMLKRLDRVDRDKLDRRLRSVADALGESEAERWREPLAARLLKRAKALGTAVEEAGHMYEAERLHRARIAAKKLRYAMELAAETGVRAAAAPVRVLKRTQETLGRLHDVQVLHSYVAAAQAKPPSRTPQEGSLEILGRLLEEECRHLHARYVSGIPALQELVKTTRREVVPQLAAARRTRRRQLKMAIGQGRRGLAAGNQS